MGLKIHKIDKIEQINKNYLYNFKIVIIKNLVLM